MPAVDAQTKTNPGNFFEDFTLGQRIDHATPRTVTEGDRALYGALYPTRFALPSSSSFAAASGLAPAPVEELIGFHIAFGKTVPDISLNAVANLGYAECRFHRPVRTGDTLRATLRGDRPQGELQRQDRCRLRAVDRDQPARRGRHRLGPLGDGAQAGPRRAGPRDGRAGAVRRTSRRPISSSPRGWTSAPTTIVLAGSPYRFGDYAGRREDRPRRRRDPRGGRAHAGDPPLAEHRQGALQHRGPRRTAAG